MGGRDNLLWKDPYERQTDKRPKFKILAVDSTPDCPVLFVETDETDIHGNKLFTLGRIDHIKGAVKEAYRMGWVAAMRQENAPEATNEPKR